ncbi:DUF1348 domain-containing protein [Histoplasma capsulatum G186AR]|uniref:DUF1348 domain-containing protein n=2 Tax=Ajellomyces capsulatus TaxID=5037 RepID=C0NN14_AJECG|nr:DUF1348 domain-containing protein [Histoplasma capsulatum G186AR]EEH07262.1 DUF1348 domain-containing protein [Histoplasma capsulatum G186AR]KAG5304614.1 DUF1348 domain-containing protein [Histoplasma capsulatum]QSS70212.1 DUF1348 domain-containing protein [Histoplasma capsulatum G186AR]
MAGLLPPYTEETAKQKVQRAQDLWNSKNPPEIAKAYTPTSTWRNRDQFFSGTEDIETFLTNKFAKEINYKLRKELFAFTDNRIAVQFWYEYQDRDDSMKWKRCYGIEHWTFETEGEHAGKMQKRNMSGNDVLIGEGGNGDGRWYE